MGQDQAAVRYLKPAGLSTPTGYSYGVEIGPGRTIYVAGQVALDALGRLVGSGDLEAQTVQVFENIKAVLAEAGAGFEHIIKCNYYLTDISQMAVVREVRNRYFNPERMPASTAVEVSRLVLPEWLVEIEVVAYLPAG